FILSLLNSPGWLRYIGERNVKTPEAARAYLENGPLRSYRENGFGLMIAVQQSDRRPVGMCGLLRRSDLPYPDLGFALLPEFTGMGYGTEMAEAVLDDGRTRLGFQTVLAITMPENNHSIRLLGKIGFRFLEHFSFPDNPEVLLLYENRHHAI
ncbi:MAG TPA: GNAT family N-acetyltransferase, partial [Puia sp.]|nr:GNAT family N-acetyltransferase [Puia sp.]